MHGIYKERENPPFATINNMHVDEIPPELSRLNTMEQRLISRMQAFMKLIVLPLGQRALAGQTINFHVNVSEVYNSLPMPLNSDGVVLVKPLKSTSATVPVPSSDQTTSTSSGPESARAGTSTNSACANTAQSSTCTSTRNLFVVKKPMVVDVLKWLKENNLYSDVNIDESVIESNDCPVNNDRIVLLTSFDNKNLVTTTLTVAALCLFIIK